jgi:LPXTG-site transpeptidase (sortase) family protein
MNEAFVASPEVFFALGSSFLAGELGGVEMKAWSNVFAAVSLLAFGYWCFLFLSGRLYQARETQRFVRERQVKSQSLETLVPSNSPKTEERPYPDKGSAVALLAIPRLGVSAVVVEGAEDRDLKLGPGHIPGTSLPGDGGNIGVAGHRDTFFRPLRLIRKDDAIQMTTHDQEHQYKVVSMKIVTPDDVQVLYPIGQETLTLVTCYPFDFVGSAPKRFVVRADCVDCRAQKQIQKGDGR